MPHHRDWSLPGAKGARVSGSTHVPKGDAKAVVVLVHGFKGYKDYGMLVHLAGVMARSGCVVHRISLSHSGMGHGHGDFDESLFERDTWNRGVEDILAVCASIDAGTTIGGQRPRCLVGHSRGGALSLLAAGRHASDGALGPLCGVVALSAPARLNGFDASTRQRLLHDGRLPLPSARTKQTLHVGSGWLQEQLDDPAAHDLESLAGDIAVPVLLVHGADDPTVCPADATVLAEAIGAQASVVFVDGGNHVFNTPNPFDINAAPSAQLDNAESAIVQFIDSK